MKTVQEGNRSSIFQVKLLTVFVLSFLFARGIVDGPLDPGFPYPEDYAESYAEMVAFSPALLIVIFLAVWNFRRMHIFATLAGSMALWLIWVIYEDYWPGFNTDFPNSFQPSSFFVTALIWAIPFLIIYLIWRFWPRRQTEGLPAA